MSICFHCGKRLTDIFGRTAAGVVRDYHGGKVQLHKSCSKKFDADRSPTARATTSTDGHVYADDGAFSPFRTVYKRPGDMQ